MPYFYSILVGVDQLGNTLAGGDPDNTISARVGYFSHEKNHWSRFYWIFLEKVIDLTFWPIDGRGHCHRAYHTETGLKFQHGSDIARAILSVLIIISCVLIIPVLYLMWLLKIVKPRTKSKQEIIEDQLLKIKRTIKNIETIITEETDDFEEIPKDFLDNLFDNSEPG